MESSHAERLFQRGEHRSLWDEMQTQAEPMSAEDKWRAARAARFLSLESEGQEERKRWVFSALELAQEAVAQQEYNWQAHKWLGIALNEVGQFEGTKTQLQNAFIIKQHWERAFELNGRRDATTAYLLGEWCFYFANMGWVTRKLASALFASPPSSSYEEALQYFLLAEELEPGFSLVNRWCIARTYRAMGNKEEFQSWLEKAKNTEVRDKDDEKAMREMQAI